MSTVSSLSLRHLQVDAAVLVAVVQLQGPPEGPAGLLLSPVAEVGKPHQIVAVDLISYIVRGSCQVSSAALSGEETGFHSENSFCTCFKKAEKMTPGQYRAAVLAKQQP